MFEVGQVTYSKHKHPHDVLALIVENLGRRNLPDISGIIYLSLAGVSTESTIKEVVENATISLFGFDRAPEGSRFDLLGTLTPSQAVQIFQRSLPSVQNNLQKSKQIPDFVKQSKK